MTQDQYLDLKAAIKRIEAKIDLFLYSHKQAVDAISREAIEEIILPAKLPHITDDP